MMERAISTLFNKILVDPRVRVWHIGIYLALVLLWEKNQRLSPFQITRRAIMNLARTKSIATYHRYMKELELFGYIRYLPSYHPREGSRVWVV